MGMNPGLRGLWLGIALSACFGNAVAETIPPGEPIHCAKNQNQHLYWQDNFHGITIDFSEETQLGVTARHGDGAENKCGQVISLRPFSCTRE
jgi:hypothetical protein